MTPEEIARALNDLQNATGRETVAQAAVDIAGSGAGPELGALAGQLRRSEFLHRLDAIEVPPQSVSNLKRVFEALEQNPTPVTAKLCLILANDSEFLSLPRRMNFLLPALAAVRPMDESAAAVFRRTNEEGFYSINAPLLIKNRSPLALEVFKELILSETIEVDDKLYLLHHAVVPYRTDIAVIEMAAELARGPVAPAVALGVIESVFDYQERPWYGNALRPPRPPAWENATPEARQFAAEWARELRNRGDLPPALAAAIRAAEVL